jgi:hypothetical protein
MAQGNSPETLSGGMVRFFSDAGVMKAAVHAAVHPVPSN